MTVPAGIFFPLCSMNVAFDRELIGPAMMQGLMGDGQPWARYDDMFSGWAAKSVSDHLGIGIKSGMPYIKHNKASNPFLNLRKEYLGLWWQELVLRFFMKEVRYSPLADTPSKAYKELAGQIRTKLQGTHEYFNRLATAMEMWTDFWDLAVKGEISFQPIRKFQSDLRPINLEYFSNDSYMTDSKTIHNLNLVKEEEVMEKSLAGPRTKLKIFVYDLPYDYSLENYLKTLKASSIPKSNCDWNMNVCNEETWVGEYSTMRQYGADAIFISKFRRYANRVYDPDDADIFVVPFPHSSMCRYPQRAIWEGCRGRNNFSSVNSPQKIQAMVEGLQHLNNETKKFHLFLLTGDTGNHFPFLLDMPLYVSLGQYGKRDSQEPIHCSTRLLFIIFLLTSSSFSIILILFFSIREQHQHCYPTCKHRTFCPAFSIGTI